MSPLAPGLRSLAALARLAPGLRSLAALAPVLARRALNALAAPPPAQSRPDTESTSLRLRYQGTLTVTKPQ
jgi:hypothetical protein